MRRGATNPFPQTLHFDNAGHLNGRRLIEITRDFPVITSAGVFTVPAGFLSDGASIPQLAHSIVGHPFDEYLESAVWHDYLYAKDSNPLGFSRKQADNFLRETMWNRDIPVWKVAAFHMAVRAGGWRSWKKR